MPVAYRGEPGQEFVERPPFQVAEGAPAAWPGTLPVRCPCGGRRQTGDAPRRRGGGSQMTDADRSAGAAPRTITLRLLREWPLPQPETGGDKDERGRVLVIGGA